MGRQEEETARLDQPGDGRLVSKKAQRKVDHLRSMQYEVTPAQNLQRREMVTAGQALDSLIGVAHADDEIVEQAVNIIRNTPNTLVLNFAQWAEVQKLVEVAVLVGMDMIDEEEPCDG